MSGDDNNVGGAAGDSAPSAAQGTVLTQRDGAVATVTLQRVDKRNALNTAMCDAIREAVEQVADDGARAIVLTGEGTAFCSGADLSGDVYSSRFPLALVHMLHVIQQVPVPVIAAVNGPAIGAGTQLALACDLRVAGGGARFEVPVAKVGLAVHNWTVTRLTEMIGGGHARSVLMGVESVDAERACTLGLANRAGDVVAAQAWAAELAGLAPLSLKHLKMVFNDDKGRSAATDEQTALFKQAWASEDRKEASRARKDGRAPVFHGR